MFDFAETNSCARRSEKSHLDSSSAVSARSCMSELITAQSGTPSEGTILAAVAASFIKGSFLFGPFAFLIGLG